MRCERVHYFLPLYLDSELSPETSFEVAEHLERCESCCYRVEQEEKLEKTLQNVLSRSQAEYTPAWRRALRGFDSHVSKPSKARQLVAAAILLAISLATFVLLPKENDLALAMYKSHKKYLEGSMTPLIDTNNPHKLSDYFKKKQTFSTELGNVPKNLSLLGGRTCYLNQSACMFLMGHVDNKAVSFFVMDTSQLTAFSEAGSELQKGTLRCEIEGYQALAFIDKDRVICAMGKMPHEKLEKLTREFIERKQP